jgi:hypothetical protein
MWGARDQTYLGWGGSTLAKDQYTSLPASKFVLPVLHDGKLSCGALASPLLETVLSVTNPVPSAPSGGGEYSGHGPVYFLHKLPGIGDSLPCMVGKCFLLHGQALLT